MTDPEPLRRLHLLLERAATLFRESLRAVASAHDLKLVQLEALLYLSMANRFSDTPAAIAEYLGVTKGTTSQTLKALELRGLITKRPDPDDARVIHCAATPEGRAIADAAYPAPLLGKLSADAARRAADGLSEALTVLQAGPGTRAFGVCRTCRHFRPRRDGGFCGLLEVPLTRPMSRQLCREHTAPVK